MLAGEKSVPLVLKTPKRRVETWEPDWPPLPLLLLKTSNCQPEDCCLLLCETICPYGSIFVGLIQKEIENCIGLSSGEFIISIDSLYSPRISSPRPSLPSTKRVSVVVSGCMRVELPVSSYASILFIRRSQCIAPPYFWHPKT